MYPGFPLSNILESSSRIVRNVLYQPHYSVYDLCMLDMDLCFHSIDQNVGVFFDPKSGLVLNNNNTLSLKSYSVFVTNNAMLSLKHNIATGMHLNSLFICHDENIIHLKKEDGFLLCQNAIRPNDAMCSYLSSVKQNFQCTKIPNTLVRYCIPSDLTHNGTTDRTSIALLCYNKQLPNNYLSQIVGNNTLIENLNKIPVNINNAKETFNKYKAVVELDPGSIINVLWAIKCGCVGIIVDNNNSLKQYANIPNLYIVQSIQQLSGVINNVPEYENKEWPKDMFIDLSSFKDNMLSVFQQISQKVFKL